MSPPTQETLPLGWICFDLLFWPGCNLCGPCFRALRANRRSFLRKALIFYQPKRIAITGGYHGCHATIEVYRKSRGVNLEIIDLDAAYKPGDLCWLETPLNPTGEARQVPCSCLRFSRTNPVLTAGISSITRTRLVP